MRRQQAIRCALTSACKLKSSVLEGGKPAASRHVKAVESVLNKIDYAKYSARVAQSVAKKAVIQDRIRIRSLNHLHTFL